MADPRRFLSELKRRRVWSAAVGYAVVAWVVIEVADTILPRLYLPDWTVTAVIILALAGFPVAVVLAWYFDVVADPASRGPRGSYRIGVMLVGGALLLSAGMAALLWPRLAHVRPEAPADGAAQPSLVVLPFSMVSPEQDDEYLADGMTEELIGVLGRLPEVRVLARTTSFALKGPETDARRLADSLGVGLAVTGSVRRAGSRIRTNAQVVNLATGYQLWSDSYDASVDSVLSVQEQIARSIAAALDLRLPRGLPTSKAYRRAVDPTVYDLYLRGRHAWRRRTQEGLELALDYFNQALAKDSTFAPALVGLGDVYRNLAGYGYRSIEDDFARAEAVIERALRLDPDLAEAHAARGLTLALVRGDRQRSLASFQHAIQLNPNDANVYHWRGIVLAELGRLPEALDQYRRAAELDPLAPAMHSAYGRALSMAGDLARAETMVRRATKLAPDLMLPQVTLSKVHERQGRLPESLAAARAAVELAPDNPHALAQLARVSVLTGDTASALRTISSLESQPNPCAACLAEALAALGDADRLFKWLDAGRWQNLGGTYYPKADPAYDRYRRDPRFRRFLEGAGLN